MAIVPAKTTEKSDAMAMAGVMKTLSRSADLIAGGASARKKRPHDLAAPHDVYTLSLKDFHKGLSKAKRTALRYFVMSGNRAVAAADLERSTSTAKPKWLHLNQGSLVSASLAALESAELLSATQKVDFELRVLQIPEPDRERPCARPRE